MKRDSRGRFKPKGIVIPIPSGSSAITVIFLIFLLIPWLYAGLKFKFAEKIFGILSYVFSNCKCPTDNEGENKY